MYKNKKNGIRYGREISWSERELIVNEFLTGNYTKTEIWRKYTGQNEEHGQILRWMKKLGHSDQEVIHSSKKRVIFTLHQDLPSLSKNEVHKSKEELEKEIELLKKRLENAELKAEGYQLMIEIAEKEYKIPIQKKPNTK